MTGGAGVQDRSRGRLARARMVGLTLLAATALAPQAAQAQFFWNQPRFSPDDAARAAMQRGYRVLTRPMRNDDVYVADVIDRRGVRQRLILSADNGQILQRYVFDPGRGGPRLYGDPSIPPGPVPPARIPQEESHPGFFARLFGGDGDQADRPPAPDSSMIEQPAPRPKPRRPRVVEQAPETIHQTPVESAPLAPPTASPVPPHVNAPKPVPPKAPAQASLPSGPAANPTAPPPAPVTPPAGDRPVRSISTNPLALPGTREEDEKTSKPAQAAAAPAKTTAPAAPAVPVAPLE